MPHPHLAPAYALVMHLSEAASSDWGFLQLCTMVLFCRLPSLCPQPRARSRPVNQRVLGGEPGVVEGRSLSLVRGCLLLLPGLPSSATGTPSSRYFWTPLPSSCSFMLFLDFDGLLFKCK